MRSLRLEQMRDRLKENETPTRLESYARRITGRRAQLFLLNTDLCCNLFVASATYCLNIGEAANDGGN